MSKDPWLAFLQKNEQAEIDFTKDTTAMAVDDKTFCESIFEEAAGDRSDLRKALYFERNVLEWSREELL